MKGGPEDEGEDGTSGRRFVVGLLRTVLLGTWNRETTMFRGSPRVE